MPELSEITDLALHVPENFPSSAELQCLFDDAYADYLPDASNTELTRRSRALTNCILHFMPDYDEAISDLSCGLKKAEGHCLSRTAFAALANLSIHSGISVVPCVEHSRNRNDSHNSAIHGSFFTRSPSNKAEILHADILGAGPYHLRRLDPDIPYDIAADMLLHEDFKGLDANVLQSRTLLQSRFRGIYVNGQTRESRPQDLAETSTLFFGVSGLVSYLNLCARIISQLNNESSECTPGYPVPKI